MPFFTPLPVPGGCSEFALKIVHDQGLIGSWSIALERVIPGMGRSVKISTSRPELVAQLPDSAIHLLQ